MALRSLSGNTIAMAGMCLATFCFASHDSIAKFLSMGYPIALVLWSRYMVHAFAMGAYVVPRMGLRAFVSQAYRLHVLRALCLISVASCFLMGLRYIPLAESTAVIFLSPIFVLLLSRLLFAEAVQALQWVAVGIGLAGVLLIVRPGGELWTPAVLLPTLGALFLSGYQLLTRMVAVKDGSAKSNFLVGLLGCGLTSLALPFVWVTPSAAAVAWMVFMGLLGMAGHMLLAYAYGKASPARLAPFSYCQIVFALLLGFAVYGHWPDAWAVAGMGLIALSGMVAMRARRSTAQR